MQDEDCSLLPQARGHAKTNAARTAGDQRSTALRLSSMIFSLSVVVWRQTRAFGNH